jgi:hypothetical protein
MKADSQMGALSDVSRLHENVVFTHVSAAIEALKEIAESKNERLSARVVFTRPAGGLPNKLPITAASGVTAKYSEPI